MTTYLGKSCSFGLLRVPFVNCRQFMYYVISLLVLRAGCGIWLYQFPIIAYHFTTEIIEAFKSTSRYLDDLLNIDSPYFEGMVNRIYPPELQLNKAKNSDTEAPFWGLHLSISNGFVSSKIYDKRDDFDFDIVNFPYLDADVPRSTSNRVYISQLIRFARVCIHVADFNARNKSLTAKLLLQVYRYHKLRKTFSKFYRRHYELVSKFNVGLKPLLHQGLSEPEFYGDLVYKFKKNWR